MPPILNLPVEIFNKVLSYATFIPLEKRRFDDNDNGPPREIAQIVQIALVCRCFKAFTLPYIYRAVSLTLTLQSEFISHHNLKLIKLEQELQFCNHITLNLPYSTRLMWSEHAFDKFPSSVKTLWVRMRSMDRGYFQSLIDIVIHLDKLENVLIDCYSNYLDDEMTYSSIKSRLLTRLTSQVYFRQHPKPPTTHILFDYSTGSKSYFADLVESTLGFYLTAGNFELELWQSNLEKPTDWTTADIIGPMKKSASNLKYFSLLWKPADIHASLDERPLGVFDFTHFEKLQQICMHPIFISPKLLTPYLRQVSCRWNHRRILKGNEGPCRPRGYPGCWDILLHEDEEFMKEFVNDALKRLKDIAVIEFTLVLEVYPKKIRCHCRPYRINEKGIVEDIQYPWDRIASIKNHARKTQRYYKIYFAVVENYATVLADEWKELIEQGVDEVPW